MLPFICVLYTCTKHTVYVNKIFNCYTNNERNAVSSKLEILNLIKGFIINESLADFKTSKICFNVELFYFWSRKD